MSPLTANPLVGRVTRLLRDRVLVTKAAKFATIGLFNTIVDFSVFSLGYLYFGLPIIPANVMAWIVGVSGSYILNSRVTFAAETGGKLGLRTYAKFLTAQLGGFLANTTTVLIASYFIPVMAGKVLAIGASFLVNFSLSNFVVFRSRHRRDSI
jgi:putative flippase GtrA